VNQPVFDLRGQLLGVADILDPLAGVVGEYDGGDHRSAARHSADVDRESRLRDVGLEVFRVTGADLRRREHVVARLHAARERALRTPPGHGAWTIEPPMDRAGELPLHDRLEQIAMWERWERESGAAEYEWRRVVSPIERPELTSRTRHVG
jgi:hypothetical protein